MRSGLGDHKTGKTIGDADSDGFFKVGSGLQCHNVPVARLLYADSSTQARSNAQDSCSYAPIMQYCAKIEMQRCDIAMHLSSKHVRRALLPKHSCCRRDKQR